jgi:ADP-ribose pyrophosphatase YjhB (NUDIX family)
VAGTNLGVVAHLSGALRVVVPGTAHRVFFLKTLGRLLLLFLGGLGLLVHGDSSRRAFYCCGVGELAGWKFCPRCRSGLRSDEQRIECPECGFIAYASSKPTAGALCEDAEGRVLLARRADEPFKGRWDIPGGFLEEGEHPLDGIRRELREETGLEVEPVDFLGVWMDRYGGDSTAEATLNLYWTARVVGGEPQAADDVDALKWFGAAELPPADELAFENVPLVLSAWRARHEHA